MQPNSDNQRGLQVPSGRGSITPPSQRDAAADMMRQQINKIYDEPQPNEQIAMGADSSDDSLGISISDDGHISHQTSQTQAPATNVQDHWQKYHSAWQQYYQMYYERYYQNQVQHQLEESQKLDPTPKPSGPSPEEILTKDQAVSELRNELMDKVRSQSEKIRNSRHFMPAIVAVVVALSFMFLQWNQIIFANVLAYTSPASLDNVPSFIDPSGADVTVGPEPQILIPTLAVQAPVIYDLNTLDESVVNSKLEKGVVHYPIRGANAMPGEIGNSVILGHSANDVFAAGDYKFIFLRLEQLQIGDRFYLNYESKRYTYLITEKKVIRPTQIDALVINNGKPMATLVTCTPIGTARDRLLIIGEQISPDPSSATAQKTEPQNTDTQEIGGGTKSFLERVFGGN